LQFVPPRILSVASKTVATVGVQNYLHLDYFFPVSLSPDIARTITSDTLSFIPSVTSVF